MFPWLFPSGKPSWCCDPSDTLSHWPPGPLYIPGVSWARCCVIIKGCQRLGGRRWRSFTRNFRVPSWSKLIVEFEKYLNISNLTPFLTFNSNFQMEMEYLFRYAWCGELWWHSNSNIASPITADCSECLQTTKVCVGEEDQELGTQTNIIREWGNRHSCKDFFIFR